MATTTGPHGAIERLRQPDAVDRPLRLAALAHLDGDLELAHDLYGDVLAADPTNQVALANLGLLLQQRGRLDDALEVLGRLPDAEECSTIALTNLALAKIGAGSLRVGIELLETAASRDPANAPWISLSKARLMEADLDGAVDAAERAVSQRPTDADRWRHLGTCRAATSDLDGAVDAFGRATDLRPSDAAAWRQLGAAFLARRDFGSAGVATERACALDPDSAASHHQLGLVATAVGEPDLAGDAFDRVLELDEHASPVDRAIVHLAQNQPDAAVAVLASRPPTEASIGRHKLYEGMANLMLDQVDGAQQALCCVGEDSDVRAEAVRLLGEMAARQA